MKVKFFLGLGIIFFFISCSSKKFIYKSNQFYLIKKKTDPNGSDSLQLVKPVKSFKGEVVEKTDYIIIKPEKGVGIKDSIFTLRHLKYDEGDHARVDNRGKFYYSEEKYDTAGGKKSFKYFDIKVGLQALTVPFKIRKSVGDDALNPPQVETGLTIGFAPGWKFSHNVYKTSKNYLGKNVSQYSLILGPHFGFGSADLKKASNSPGLLSDRKSAVFTYGLYSMIGLNNINLGFAIGKDYLMGSGKNYWVYQGKTWKGIIIGLDLLKF